MGMIQYEGVVRMIDNYVKQLEGLMYSKQAGLAAQLKGAIDAMILVAGVTGDAWNKRVEAALDKIMRDPPENKPLEPGLPDVLAQAVTLGTGADAKTGERNTFITPPTIR